MDSPPSTRLAALGWDEFFARPYAELAADGLEAGRVIAEHQHLFRVATESGELLAGVTGRIRHRAAGREAFPSVGDWVALRPLTDEGRATIHAVLPRKSKFSRKAAGNETEEQVIAANIDTAFLVSGLDQDISVRRIERYLITARAGGVAPVVVLNKADRCPDAAESVSLVTSAAPGVPVVPVSARTGDGLDVLFSYIGPSRTVVFLGSSGVGKSTLINRIAGQELLRTREVRESDSKGRHTTTYRQLIVLPGGGLLIDTPGMRELQLWDGNKGLDDTFEDIGQLGLGCHFRDCRHETEPGCAVRAEVEAGRFPAGRLEHFVRLRREQEHVLAQADERAQQNQKRKTRATHKALQDFYRRRDQ